MEIKIGVDYYPEQWTGRISGRNALADYDSFLENDIALMKEAGVKIVRMAEFAWSRLEPEEGKYEFGWLDRAVEKMNENDIDVILGTPTCTPPRWLFRAHPEITRCSRGGNRESIGVRGHRCIVNHVFREYAEKIIREMVSHYAENDAVKGYQIDNELESNYCGCPECREAFRNWVIRKYAKPGEPEKEVLSRINDIYGNYVWSGDYSSYEDITIPPEYDDSWLNPSLMLDHARFASESLTDYVEFQRGIIRDIDKDALITTNTWFCKNLPDFYRMYKNLDFVSFDNYPTTDVKNISSHAFHLDLMRGIKDSSFCIMEGLSGATGSWTPMSETPAPGMIKGYALQAAAHGADTILNFRFRTAVKGAEMYWHGLIGHDNVPGRRFDEFRELTDVVKVLNEFNIGGSKVISDAAILYSPEDEAAFRMQYQGKGMYYLESHMAWHRALTRFGVGVDVISAGSDFISKNYKLIVAPSMYIYSKKVSDALHEYAEKGGTIIFTPRTGIKDENNNCIMEPIPSWASDLAGIKIDEYDPVGERQYKVMLLDKEWQRHLSDINLSKPTDFDYIMSTHWRDLITPVTAKVLAVYADRFYAGTPAVTINKYGKGCVYYVGTYFEDVGYESLLISALGSHTLKAIDAYSDDSKKRKGDNPYAILPEGIEVTRRRSDEREYTFIFNDSNARQVFKYKNEDYDLNPFEMMIIYHALGTKDSALLNY